MKKLILSMALLGASSLLSPSIAGSSVTKFQAALDGYCNVFNLKMSGFELYGTRSGCDAKLVEGGVVAEINGTTWIMPSDKNPGDKKHVLTWYFTPPVSNAGNWYLYSSDGKSYTEINSGTYSKPTPGGDGAKRGEKSAEYGRN